MDKTIDLVSQFNSLNLIDKHIFVNEPQVWTFSERSGSWFIQSYEKFNSNSGWRNLESFWPQVMQALSHFTYHISGGQFVLSDLQGGIYSNGVVVSDPAILSRSKMYGVTDLGPEGIITFFHRHKCTSNCRAEWTRPSQTVAFFPMNQGTSMLSTRQGQGNNRVPTQASHSPLSRNYY